MVPVWISPPPRDVPTQTQQRTRAEIFQIRPGTYFSVMMELFRVCNVIPDACNRRSIATPVAACRHRMDASSTWFARAPCHKNFLCGSTLRLRVPGVVTLCEESREGRQHSRAEFDTHGRSLRLRPLRLRPLRLRHPSSRLRLSLCPA